LLPDWPQRRRSELLLADLAELSLPAPPPLPQPDLTSTASLLGAVYVLEGSRLGGVYLERSLPGEMPRRFLAALQARGAWRDLLTLLDQELSQAQALDEATDSAIRVFRLFEAAARDATMQAT
jgi:heme oxygenase